MTSPEAKSVAKRRSAGGVTSDATARHTGMFSWSAGHVNVRDLIMTQLPQIPTIVRISTGYRSEQRPRRFDFHEGSLYLVRSVRFRQLVVAQTPDKNFITIPRDCPLTFHLVSNNDTLANVALTLADILGGIETGDLGPCNGQRVQLSSSQRTDYADWIPGEARGHLELKEIYKETFLLCHAFIGGTLNREQTVVPGYLPLKLNVAQSMMSGTDLGKYVLTLCQAVADYSNEYVSNDPHEIAMFTEPPVKIYEWIEPRRISEPDPNPVSTFKPSKPFASTSVHNTAPVTRPFASHNVFRERFSLDSKVSRRPLPPIPKEVANPPPERNDSGLYKKFRNTNVDALRWQSRVFGARSKPLARCGSEPNLVGEDRQPRLSSSSQSLDTLDAADPQPEETRSKPTVKNAFLSLPRHCRPQPPASAVATGNREPRPASDPQAVTSPDDGKTAAAAVRPLPAAMMCSPEDAVQSARGKWTTRTSTLRRQRPVSPGVRPRSATYRHSSLEELTASVDRPHEHDLDPAEDVNPALPVVASAAGATSADDSRRLRVQKPPDIELPPAAALTSAQYSIDEGYYDSIVSPTYLVMTRPTASARRTSQPSAADSIAGSTGINDGALYANTRRLQELPPRDHRRPVLTHQSENASGKHVNQFPDDDDGYCMPHPYISLLKDAERGEGVGAEEDRNLYCGPTTAKTVRSTGNPSSVRAAASLLQLGSLKRVGFTSLDDVPVDLGCLSVVEVLQCLRWLHLDRYVDRFRAEQIDGELLMSLDQQLLVEEFEFKRFDAMKLEKFARSGWRPKEDRAPLDNCYYYQQQQPCIQLQHSPNEPLYTDV